MKDNFQPQTPFEGYMKAKIEDIEQKFDKLSCIESFMRLGKCETDIANIKGKATILGAVMGFIAGVISKVIWGKQ